MKKYIYASFLAFFLTFQLLPISVQAGTGFVASRNSEVFHILSCYHVDRIYDSNKIYFDTYKEAVDSGRRGCYHCHPSDSYDREGNRVAVTKNEKLKYIAGYETGKHEGYELGYSDGKKDTEGIYKKKLELEREDAIIETSFVFLCFINPFLYFILKPRSKK